MNWLRLVRWINLCVVLLAHLLFRYFLFPIITLNSTLNGIEFFALSFSILCVTASGNIINDIFDVDSDRINNRKRPLATGGISLKSAYILYSLLIVIAICLASFVSYKTNTWWLLFIEIATIYALYLYAKRLKGIAIIGNVLVSSLVSLSFLIVVLIELPVQLDHISLNWILFYGIFAFWTNLNREIIKDLQDIKGDYFKKYNTLPIILGRSRTNTVLFFSTSLLIIAIVVGVKNYLLPPTSTFIYFIFGACFPMVFVAYQIFKLQEKVKYARLSIIYKLVMLAGLLSMVAL